MYHWSYTPLHPLYAESNKRGGVRVMCVDIAVAGLIMSKCLIYKRGVLDADV